MLEIYFANPQNIIYIEHLDCPRKTKKTTASINVELHEVFNQNNILTVTFHPHQQTLFQPTVLTSTHTKLNQTFF